MAWRPRGPSPLIDWRPRGGGGARGGAWALATCKAEFSSTLRPLRDSKLPELGPQPAGMSKKKSRPAAAGEPEDHQAPGRWEGGSSASCLARVHGPRGVKAPVALQGYFFSTNAQKREERNFFRWVSPGGKKKNTLQRAGQGSAL